MDLATIGNLVGIAGMSAGGLKTSAEFVGTVKELLSSPKPDMIEVKKLIAEVYDKLIAAKEAQMTIHDTLMELQKDEMKQQRFAAEAERYALTTTDMGALIYALLPEKAGGQPVHYLCPQCFEDQVKSVLQPSQARFNALSCNRCNGCFPKSDGRSGAVTVPLQSDWDPFD
ncbi:hypothetical protein [Pararhodobacter sp.]|uniref:hypothetical protein n=1 Tax=Pararhodobacter sp. TaxID=2127056 RepID=UPI002AFFD454|nr:hypothetical protein [Pararhodobacter sp.]